MTNNAGNAFQTAELLTIKERVAPFVRSVGEFAEGRFDEYHASGAGVHVDQKTSSYDVVTDVDVECERRIVAFLREEFPEFGLLGEEGANRAADGEPTWVIDPIDGTFNLVRGYPGFGVCVGLFYEGESIMGFTYDASQRALYWAVKGGGAWCDDRRLHLPRRSLAESLIAENYKTTTCSPFGHDHVFSRVAPKVLGTRNTGAPCLNLCYVAEGWVDLYWQFGLQSWDVMSGLAIVEEAGGAKHFFGGEELWWEGRPFDLIVGSPTALSEALSLL